MVRKEVVGSVISCTPISSRLISLRISPRAHNITVIQVYVLTSDHEAKKVEQFYKQPGGIMTEIIFKKARLVAQGDWNAEVGPAAYRHWAGTVRRSGIGRQTTEYGDSLSSERATESPLPKLSTCTSRIEQQPGMPPMGRFITR